MAKTTTPSVRKVSAKTPMSKSKCGGNKKDRLTVEQRQRVEKYRRSLNAKPSVNEKFSPATKLDGDLEMEKGANGKDSHPIAGFHPSMTAGQTPYKTAGLLVRSRHSPESEAEVSRGLRKGPTLRQVHQSAPARSPHVSVNPKPMVRADCKGTVDPPSFISATEAPFGVEKKRRSIDPPCNENEAPKEAPKEVVTIETELKKDGSPTAPTFSKELNSRWTFLRRSLQALGIVGSDTQGNGSADGAAHDDNEHFYDAMEFDEQHLVEDVSDEDEEIMLLRSAAKNQVPKSGQSWMEPIKSPTAGKRPDP